MNFFDNYYAVGKKVKSKAARHEYFAAIIEYYYSGGVEPQFKHDAAEIAFEGVRYSLNRSIRNARNRSGTKAEGNANEDATKHDCVPKSSREEEEEVTNVTSLEEEGASFALSCLKVLNDTLGTTYSTIPTECIRTLERFEGSYSTEEIRAMVSAKRDEWEGDAKTRGWLTPHTLFSPKNFEKYMIQTQQAREEAAHGYDHDDEVL